MVGECLPTLNYGTYVVACLVILDTRSSPEDMREGREPRHLLERLVKDRFQSLHFHSRLFIVLDSTKSPNSYALNLFIALLKRLNRFQSPCLGWRELLLRHLFAWRWYRDLWKLLTNWWGVIFIGLLSCDSITWRLRRLLAGRWLCGNVGSWWYSVYGTAASFLILPLTCL